MGVIRKLKDFFVGSQGPINVTIDLPVTALALPDASGMEKRLSPTKIALLRNPALTYSRIGTADVRGYINRTPSYAPPEYDLVELGKLDDLDGYVRRAFRNKEGLMFKEGYNFVGSNVERVEYIKARIAQMERASGTPFPLLMRQTAANLLKYSNAFWVKVRNPDASGGAERKLPNGQTIKPIAAYFSVPAETMLIDATINGTIRGYKQELPTGETRTFSPRDVIHFYVDRKDGFLFGTPITVPVQNDIYALRRIEENVETLVHQCLFPLYQYKVGSETSPGSYYPDGRSEIDVVRYEMTRMPPEGMIITPYTHEIANLGSGERGLQAESYLAYFKQRVFSGLGVSSVDMGESGTSNRSTAATLSQNMVDDVKSYQDVIETFIDECVLKELLLESTFEPKDLFEEDNLVHLRFLEIDIENRMKIENQVIQLFENNAITHTEMRRTLGKEPFKTDEEWMDTAWELYKQPALLLQSMAEPFGSAAQAAGASEQTAVTPQMNKSATATAKQMVKLGKPAASAAGKKKPTTKAKKTTANRSRPKNQSGTRSSPKVNRDITDSLLELYKEAKQSGQDTEDKVFTSAIVQTIFARILRDLKLDLSNSLREGISSVGSSPLDPTRVRLGVLGVLEGRAERYSERLKRTLVNRVLNSQDKKDLALAFDSLEWRLSFMESTELMYAYNLGRLIGLLEQGHTEFMVPAQIDSDCPSCSVGLRFSSPARTIDYEKVPPLSTHPNCTCLLMPAERS